MPTLIDTKEGFGEATQRRNFCSNTKSSESEIRAPSETEANLLLNLAHAATRITEDSASEVCSKNDEGKNLPILTPLKHDILSGRGQRAHNHSGNIIYRRFINEERRSYVNGNPREKKFIISKLLKRIKAMSPPGRFLKGNTQTGAWEILPDDEARKKTAQALRENAVNIRKIYLPEQPQFTHILPKPSPSNQTPSHSSEIGSKQRAYEDEKKRKIFNEHQFSSMSNEAKRRAYSDAIKSKAFPIFPLSQNNIMYQRPKVPQLHYEALNGHVAGGRIGKTLSPTRNCVSENFTASLTRGSENIQKVPNRVTNTLPLQKSIQKEWIERDKTQHSETFSRRAKNDPPGSHCDEIRNN